MTTTYSKSTLVIHKDFNNAVDLFAKSLKATPIDNEKMNLLVKNNFLLQPGVEEYIKARKEESDKSCLRSTIERYKKNGKIVDRDSFMALLEKYNLIQGKTSEYVGEIPLYNLQKINNFFYGAGSRFDYRDIVIAAPAEMFDTSGRPSEIDDPIAFVLTEYKTVCIITMWGKEQSIPEFQDSSLN